MRFAEQPLGIAWILALSRAIEFVDLSINRWKELKASIYDLPHVPPELEQFFRAYQNFMPDWVVTFDDLAPIFLVPENENSVQTGLIVKDELEFIKGTMEQLPGLTFGSEEENPNPDPNPTPEPEPEPDDTTFCERLIAALENLELLTADEVRQIVTEQLQPVATEILQQGHDTRVELAQTGKRVIQNWNALHTYDSTLESPIATLDKHFELWNFPLKNIPKSFIQKRLDDGSYAPPEYREITSWLELIEWVVKLFEEMLGQYPVDLKIKLPPVDEDETEPTTETLSFPNLAELMAEIFPLVYQSWRNSEKNQELIAKNLIELVQVKKIAIQNSYRLQALEDYLGFNVNEESRDMPLTISVNAKNMDDFSKPKKQSVDIIKFPEGEKSLQNHLQLILHASEIIKAVFWRSLPTDTASATARFKELIRQQFALQNELDEENIDEVDAKMEEIERGLINKSGISDGLNPYGQPFENRPQIRPIGQTDTTGGGN